jgi:hypothetical protein
MTALWRISAKRLDFNGDFGRFEMKSVGAGKRGFVSKLSDDLDLNRCNDYRRDGFIEVGGN